MSDKPLSEQETTEVIAGIVARFDGPAELKKAAVAVRKEGFRRWDCHSPYPVHGLEKAMGVPRTILPWLVAGAGFTGAAAALLLQWWTNAVDYPYLISGKPFFSLPANIPVTFELIVLFAALTSFFGVLGLNMLPHFTHPVFAAKNFVRATDDGFFVSVEASDPKFDPVATESFLRSIGAVEIELCRVPTADRRFPKGLYWAVAVLACLALLPPLFVALARQHTPSRPQTKPRIHIIKDMDFQPKFKTQTPNPLFADGRTMRPPVEGTLPFGALDALPKDADGKPIPKPLWEDGRLGDDFATQFPIPVDEKLMQRGRERYDVYCATCHGITGEGAPYDGMTSRRARERGEPAWVPPANLTGNAVASQPVGKLVNTIANGVIRQGKHTMPGYAAQIPPEDRWAIVLYLRALQRTVHPEPKTDAQ
ncbi:DUF3341 domain-containing protein [Thermostilla marina]